jgi:aryl-alcohol dehydrogenase-like predicted oxidoreductase
MTASVDGEEGAMETRRLGRLEHESSVIIFGGAMFASINSKDADAAIEFALDSGINHFDTSDDYGESEDHLGRWMPRIRDRIFLATKTTERDKAGAARTIRRSLERLGVDHVDLLQLHAIGDDEELDAVTARGGALEACVEARDEGLIGGIGITGHGVKAAAVHLEGLQRFPFDSVLTPYNYKLARDPQFVRDFDALAAAATEGDVALMLIKAIARNQWRDEGARRYTTWYEPLDEQRAIDAAVAFALARTEAAGICAASDPQLLQMIVAAEQRRNSISEGDIDEVLSNVPDYDSPFHSTPERSGPEWLKESEKRTA